MAPPIVYGHAVLLFSWLIFFVLQASLVRVRSIRAHRRLGWFGAVLGVAVVMSAVAVSFHRVHRDLAAGVGDAALRQFVTNLFFILTFGSVVAAAIALRRDIESHKRLLLLATMWAIFPAWGNLDEVFPTVEISEVILYIVSYSPLLLGIARDLLASARVHRVYVSVGALLVALDLTVTLFAAQSAAWLRVGQWLLGEAAA